MIGTTNTTVELPSVYVISGEEITRFCYLTGDTNKAHQGDRAAVPAFFLKFLAKRMYDAIPESIDRTVSYHKSHFRGVIRRDEPFIIFPIKEEKLSDGKTVFEYNIKKDLNRTDIKEEDKIVGNGEIHYTTIPAQPGRVRYDSHGQPAKKEPVIVKLYDSQVQGVQEVLRLSQDSDLAARLATAVSLSSKALLALFDEQSGRQPYFGSQKLFVYDNIEDKLKDEFALNVRTEESAGKVRAPPVHIRGEGKNGNRIFDLTATIFYFDGTPTA